MIIMKEIRLSKRLAEAGVASRRAAEELIFEGRVAVNGEVALKPETRVTPKDKVTVDGTTISNAEKKVYYVLNKPRGYVCSSTGKNSVLNLFTHDKRRLFTVGRLDRDTTGLLLITNDGDFSNRVIHPSYNIHKEYLVKTNLEITHHHLVRISEGVDIDGSHIKPVKVEKMRRGTVKITVAEGKKHEVRILVEEAGLEVKELKRIRIGHLHLGKLPVGAWRPLSKSEYDLLMEKKCRPKSPQQR